MHNIHSHIAAVLLLSVAGTASAIAAVSAEEAKQLGGPVLTEWGAERAGNKEGTIPEYTGKRAPISANYNPNDPGFVPDPWNEKPRFSITVQNADQYADKLTEGQKAMFKKFPKYRMDVYPTHRNHVYPKYILERTLKNATACKTPDGLKLVGCYGGIPFPIAKNGNEMMWNHLMRWVAHDYEMTATTLLVNGVDGKAIVQGQYNVWEKQAFWDPEHTGTWPSDAPVNYLRFDNIGPARKVGEKYVIIDSLEMVRHAYSYIPGQRRVKLSPDLAYDTPSPSVGGVETMDQAYLFYGALDRYNFNLVGKKETFINYNSFMATNYQKCPLQVWGNKNFPDPDCVRWELHRTWVVDARLKPGIRHIYPRRTMYFDEDNLGAGTADHYDAAGSIYRYTNVQTYPLPGDFGSITDNTFTTDLQTGSWTTNGVLGVKGNGSRGLGAKSFDPFLFSPEAMASEGIR